MNIEKRVATAPLFSIYLKIEQYLICKQICSNFHRDWFQRVETCIFKNIFLCTLYISSLSQIFLSFCLIYLRLSMSFFLSSLSVKFFPSLSFSLSFCLYLFLFLYLSLFIYLYLSIYLTPFLLSIYLSLYATIYRSLFVYLSI